MERTRTSKRGTVIGISIAALLVLVAAYVPFRVRTAREEAAMGRPAPGTVLSIFVTNELAGYREPCD